MLSNTEETVSFLIEEIKPHKKIIEKDLTKEQAMSQFPYKSSMGDKRGFSYNPKTGEAVWI